MSTMVMSTTVAAFDLHAGPLPAQPAPAREARTELRPWGFWASLGWGLFAMATALFCVVIGVAIWMLTHQLALPDPNNAAFAHPAGILSSLAGLAVLVIAVKCRRFSLRSYFALDGIARRDLVVGVACLVGLMAAATAIETLFGIDAGTKSVAETYRAAKAAGALPLLWLAIVVAAPITEELLFRGFLHRGWTASRLGVTGTIVLTAVLWSALHQQYNWLGILCIFAMGLIFGWMRQRSGTTTVTITLHALNNLIATVLVTVQVEWLG